MVCYAFSDALNPFADFDFRERFPLWAAVRPVWDDPLQVALCVVLVCNNARSYARYVGCKNFVCTLAKEDGRSLFFIAASRCYKNKGK